MIVKPFSATFFALIILALLALIVIKKIFENQSERSRKIFLTILCAANIVLYFVYKSCLSVDSEFMAISGIESFNWFNELPLQLCNINMFLIPIGILTGSKPILGFSFFTAPLGAIMALIFPEPAFTGFALATPRIMGFYLTHIMLLICGLCLSALNFYHPVTKDFPGIISAFIVLSLAAHLVNIIFRLTVCSYANYFFTFGADVSILKLFWKIIPIPYIYELPSLLILLAYMWIIVLLRQAAVKLKKLYGHSVISDNA